MARERKLVLGVAVKPLLEVIPIDRACAMDLILNVHYARRSPSISFTYGLFMDGVLEGIVTFGTPSSAPLRSGIAGEEYADNILELNRLCLYGNYPNHASLLVSRAVKMLPGNRIIISFADTACGHHGTVYKASNFMYCGLSAKRTDWKVRGMEHLHGQTIADEFRGMPNRSLLMREKYGDDFYLAPRSRKHRFVRIVGTRGFRVAARKAIRYRP